RIRGAVSCAQAVLRLLELRGGIVEQHDAFEAGVARRVAAGAGAQLQQQAAGRRQQGSEGARFAQVFVGAWARVPKSLLVLGAFVVADRRPLGHYFSWNNSPQD